MTVPPFVLAALLTVLVGCSGSDQLGQRKFGVRVQVVGDDGRPLPGAQIVLGDRERGTTDADGVLSIDLLSLEGQHYAIKVKCPSGYSSPESIPPLQLASTRNLDAADTDRPVPVSITCARQIREVVLVVHADNGAGLPVVVDGEAATRTDLNGHAHLFLPLDKDASRVRISLDTESRPELKPQMPSRSYQLDGKDAILLFAQPLVEARPLKRKPAVTSRRHVPYRVK